jgi:hypothetical protein
LIPLVVVLLVVSLVMAGTALVVKLADLDVETRVGIVDFELDTDWSAGSVTYTGAAEEFGVDVEGEQVLLEGTGDFQEAVGFLKGTSKRVTNSITPYTTDALNKRATLNVSVSTDSIPWWVVGVGSKTRVEVELVEAKNVSSLTVDRVYLELRREVGGEMLTKEVWSQRPNDELTGPGDVLTYETELAVDEDWGEFQVFGMVEVTMVDTDGVTATNVKKSYSTDPKVITVWTIPTMDGVKIALVIVAMPVYVIGVLVGIVGAVIVVLNKRGKVVLPLLAAVLLALGAVFFITGVNQLAELVGYPDAVEPGVGFFIMLGGFVPALVAGILLLYWKRKQGDEADPDAPWADEEGDAPGDGASAEININPEGTVSEEESV